MRNKQICDFFLCVAVGFRLRTSFSTFFPSRCDELNYYSVIIPSASLRLPYDVNLKPNRDWMAGHIIRCCFFFLFSVFSLTSCEYVLRTAKNCLSAVEQAILARMPSPPRTQRAEKNAQIHNGGAIISANDFAK